MSDAAHYDKLAADYALGANQLRKEIMQLRAQIAALKRNVITTSRTGPRADKGVAAIADIWVEYEEAIGRFPPFHSAHEGFAVLWEEVDELWDEVKRRPMQRSKAAMRIEARQIAAMALRFIVEMT